METTFAQHLGYFVCLIQGSVENIEVSHNESRSERVYPGGGLGGTLKDPLAGIGASPLSRADSLKRAFVADFLQKSPPNPVTGYLAATRNQMAQPVIAAFLAGGVAGAVSRTIVSPLERLKILFQIQSVGREEYKMSIWKALVKMGREEGWRGFLRGNGTNCVRIIPYSAVQFGSYNFYKKVSLMSFRRPPGERSFLLSMINRSKERFFFYRIMC